MLHRQQQRNYYCFNLYICSWFAVDWYVCVLPCSVTIILKCFVFCCFSYLPRKLMPTMHVTPFSVGASRAQCLPDSKAGLAAAQPRFPQEPQDLPTEPKPFCPPFIFTAPSQPQDKGCPCKDTAMAQTHTEGTPVHGSTGDKHLTSTQGPV